MTLEITKLVFTTFQRMTLDQKGFEKVWIQACLKGVVLFKGQGIFYNRVAMVTVAAV